MNTAPQDKEALMEDPRVRFAEERTFLAWIRTGIAMMGFGFVVARFGLFLMELQATRHDPPTTLRGSFWLGTGLIVLGTLVNLVAAVDHIRFRRNLARGVYYTPRWSMATAVALTVAALGISMTVYLLFLGS